MEDDTDKMAESAGSGKRSALEEMLEEYLNPRPKSVEAAEDVIGGTATVMPYHEDFQAESASKGLSKQEPPQKKKTMASLWFVIAAIESVRDLPEDRKWTKD